MPPDKLQIASATRHQPRLVVVILGGLGILHLVTSFFPGIGTWGIDYWSSFPVGIRFGLVAIIVLAFLRPVLRGAGFVADSLVKPWWGKVLCLATLVVLFVVFHSRVYVYGDGYSFSGYFPDGRFPGLFGQLRTQMLDLIAHWAVYRAIVMPLGGAVETSYIILGPIAGLLSVWAIVRIARCLGTRPDARRLIVAAGLSSVAITLWFGYVESYALVNAGILWSVALAMEAQKYQKRIWAAWGVWIVSVGFHLLAVVFIPAILWAHWRATHSPAKELRGRQKAGVFALGFLGWMVATWVYGFVKPDVFLPLLPTANSTYTAFGWHHLADIFNLMLLLAPLGLIGVIGWLRELPGESSGPKANHSIIGVAAASMWFFSFWVDPTLGAFRDWDLLAGFGIPLSIWGGAVIARRQPRGGAAVLPWVAVGAFAVAHAGAFVATLQNSQRAMMRVDGLVREDVHYSGDFFNGGRLPPWAAVMQHNFNRPDLARDHLKRRLAFAPSDGLAWANLGGAYLSMNVLDSAAACYDQALQRDSTNAKYAKNLGLIQLERNDMVGAEDAFAKAIRLSDTSYDCHYELGYACFSLNEWEKAREALTKAIMLQPRRFEAYVYRAYVAEGQADTLAALSDYEAALERGCAVEQIYLRLMQLYQGTGQGVKAIGIGHRFQRAFPQSVDAPMLLGRAFLISGQFDSAAAALTRCLTLSPDNALATCYLATSYRNLRQFAKARELAELAARLDTTIARPYLEMAYIAADEGNVAAARVAAQEFARRAPGDTALVHLRQFLTP